MGKNAKFGKQRRSKMSNQMNDFLNWLCDDAPLWARYVVLTLSVLFLMSALVLLGALFTWAARNGYWILFTIPPAAAIWAVLRAYQKSKGKQHD
jgi:hypothetical protein